MKDRFNELIRNYKIVKGICGKWIPSTMDTQTADLIIIREVSDGAVICKVIKNKTDLTGEDIQLICEGPEKVKETDSKFCLIW